MNTEIDFKIISGNWNNGEYKYNVQKRYNGVYSGQGKFARNYKEIINYISKELGEYDNETILS